MVNVVFFNYLDLKSKLLRSNGDFMGFNQQEEGFSGDWMGFDHQKRCFNGDSVWVGGI